MAEISIYNVEGLGAPLGQYRHVARSKAPEYLFVAGMLSTDKSGAVIGDGDFDAQCHQVFRNIELALRDARADWRNVVQFTTYLVEAQMIEKFMKFRESEFPKIFPSGIYPPNTLLIISRLVGEKFLIEVQTVAAI